MILGLLHLLGERMVNYKYWADGVAASHVVALAVNIPAKLV